MMQTSDNANISLTDAASEHVRRQLAQTQCGYLPSPTGCGDGSGGASAARSPPRFPGRRARGSSTSRA